MDNIQILNIDEYSKLLEKDLATYTAIYSVNSAITKINMEYIDGMPNLIKLFQMDNDTLKTTLENLLDDLLPKNIIANASITKKIVDDIAISITLNYYDKIVIDARHITFEWENGDSKMMCKTASLKL